MKLRDLLSQDVLGYDAAVEPAVAGLEVSGLALDSRVVKPGDLFFALAGSKTDGARFIDAAIAAGAIAIVGDHASAATTVPFIAAANPRRALALAAARFFPAQPATIAAVRPRSQRSHVRYGNGWGTFPPASAPSVSSHPSTPSTAR